MPRIHRHVPIVAVLAVSAGLAACRAEAPTGPPSAAAPPQVAESQPELGNHHHPITTSSVRAQQLFNQGLTLAYGFNHEEAVRLFREAAATDPEAPMPHWGIAWALGPNYNLDIDDPRAVQASEAIARARVLAPQATPAERDYIEVMAGRYSPDPAANRPALARKYADGMRALMRKYPDDLDAATLYAESLMNLRPWKLWTLDGKPAEDTIEILDVLQNVLTRDPNHVGANHFFIHAIEASPTPERALASAERLKTLVPAAGHLVHMPAHVLSRTGDYAGAAAANAAGATADRAYAARAPQDSFYVMAYFSHNLQFLADSHMMQGRSVDAARAAAELAERLTPHADMMPMIESMVTMPLSVMLRFDRFSEILDQPAPPEGRPVMRAWWHFARGVAYARTGQPDAAATERAALVATVAAVPEEALFGGTGLESARVVLGDVAIPALDARIAEARGQTDLAIEKWTDAVRAGDRLAYDEPPVWFYPLRESLGGTLLRANRPAEAERAFRDDLARHPRNPRALFGLREALARQQRVNDAAWVSRAFDDAWRNADVGLTADGL